MQLTTHFKLEEFIRSSTAIRLGIDNTPSDEIIEHLKVTAEGLEQVRKILQIFNAPVIIDSGYRCPKLNAAVHGADNSDHLLGYAADFIIPSRGTPLEIVKLLAASDLQFDQLIQEGTWVHISFNPRMRRQVLTAHFVNGVAHYTEGV